MIKLKSTVIPNERVMEPYSRPAIGDIIDYWTKDGRINENLYLKIIKAKTYGVLG